MNALLSGILRPDAGETSSAGERIDQGPTSRMNRAATLRSAA